MLRKASRLMETHHEPTAWYLRTPPRRIQQQSGSTTSDSGGLLFLQSLIFFAIMVAIFLVVWVFTKVM